MMVDHQGTCACASLQKEMMSMCICFLNIYSHIAVCMHKCQGHGIGHTKGSSMRAKAKRRS